MFLIRALRVRLIRPTNSLM